MIFGFVSVNWSNFEIDLRPLKFSLKNLRPLIFLPENLRPLKKHSGRVFPINNARPLRYQLEISISSVLHQNWPRSIKTIHAFFIRITSTRLGWYWFSWKKRVLFIGQFQNWIFLYTPPLEFTGSCYKKECDLTIFYTTKISRFSVTKIKEYFIISSPYIYMCNGVVLPI